MRSASAKCAIVLALSVAAPLAASGAQAATFIYKTTMTGLQEANPNLSPGIGSATVTFDNVAHTLRVMTTFSGLLGTTTAAHIHAPTPTPGTGVADVATQTPTFVGFPLGVTSGSYDNTFDTLNTSTYRAAFVANNGGTAAGAEMALFQALEAGRSYVNIHSNLFLQGEIRGFLSAVPEPSTWITMITGFGAVGGALRNARWKKAKLTAACGPA